MRRLAGEFVVDENAVGASLVIFLKTGGGEQVQRARDLAQDAATERDMPTLFFWEPTPREAAGLDRVTRAVGSPTIDLSHLLDDHRSEFHTDGVYAFEGGKKSSDEMISYYADLVASYPIVSIEDPLN